MSYRDDRDADQARIAALEHELAETRDKLSTLEGRRTQALVLATRGALAPSAPAGTAARVFGPGTLRMARRFDGAFPTARFEHLIERIRELSADPGRTEMLNASLTWFASRGDRSTGPYRIVTVTVRDGVTTLTVTDRLSGLAGAIYGGVGGGVGGGGLSLPIMAATYLPVLAPVFLLGWLGGVFLGTRALYLRLVRRRAEELQQVFDALAADIERALPGLSEP
ncbi:MAG TPA: hypothetical protein VHW23_08265 [Kofleriaceae bacterium]|jgi:hypothetical protein|nr:hypothetical protein [Kofleriaceae bacterium]